MLKSQYDMLGTMREQKTLTYNQEIAAIDALRGSIKEQAKAAGCEWALMEA